MLTTRGRDRYEFAINLITNIMYLEQEYSKTEKQKDANEIKQPEPNENLMQENDFTSNEL